jgi:hypothetical protein
MIETAGMLRKRFATFWKIPSLDLTWNTKLNWLQMRSDGNE